MVNYPTIQEQEITVFKTTSKIMLVDDEKDFVEMLSLRLKENEENVIAAYNGQECLDTLEKIQVDVIILDVKMPGMDGIETLKQIKKRHPLVEVILLTGHGTIQSAVEGMKLGAFDFLLKPADFKELTEKLTKAKERRKEQMERIQKAEAAILLRQSKI
ncbi:MAG: response regulator [Desulfotignum sp.]|jgi:DNA-binding NtrC family response regulator|nr:response regulator [Desulfotignum sp.]